MEEMMNTSDAVEEIQYIVVKLGDEQYGIDIRYVDNIVRLSKITRVAKSQPYYVGDQSSRRGRSNYESPQAFWSGGRWIWPGYQNHYHTAGGSVYDWFFSR